MREKTAKSDIVFDVVRKASAAGCGRCIKDSKGSS